MFCWSVWGWRFESLIDSDRSLFVDWWREMFVCFDHDDDDWGWFNSLRGTVCGGKVTDVWVSGSFNTHAYFFLTLSTSIVVWILTFIPIHTLFIHTSTTTICACLLACFGLLTDRLLSKFALFYCLVCVPRLCTPACLQRIDLIFSLPCGCRSVQGLPFPSFFCSSIF